MASKHNVLLTANTPNANSSLNSLIALSRQQDALIKNATDSLFNQYSNAVDAPQKNTQIQSGLDLNSALQKFTVNDLGNTSEDFRLNIGAPIRESFGNRLSADSINQAINKTRGRLTTLRDADRAEINFNRNEEIFKRNEAEFARNNAQRILDEGVGTFVSDLFASRQAALTKEKAILNGDTSVGPLTPEEKVLTDTTSFINFAKQKALETGFSQPQLQQVGSSALSITNKYRTNAEETAYQATQTRIADERAAVEQARKFATSRGNARITQLEKHLFKLPGANDLFKSLSSQTVDGEISDETKNAAIALKSKYLGKYDEDLINKAITQHFKPESNFSSFLGDSSLPTGSDIPIFEQTLARLTAQRTQALADIRQLEKVGGDIRLIKDRSLFRGNSNPNAAAKPSAAIKPKNTVNSSSTAATGQQVPGSDAPSTTPLTNLSAPATTPRIKPNSPAPSRSKESKQIQSIIDTESARLDKEEKKKKAAAQAVTDKLAKTVAEMRKNNPNLSQQKTDINKAITQLKKSLKKPELTRPVKLKLIADFDERIKLLKKGRIKDKSKKELTFEEKIAKIKKDAGF